MMVKLKQPKRNDTDSDEIAASVNDDRNDVSPTLISKTNAICCKDLFEWISLEDLHSLGQTCKRMQGISGSCSRDTFNKSIKCKDQSIQLNEIIEFVRDIRRYVQVHINLLL